MYSDTWTRLSRLGTESDERCLRLGDIYSGGVGGNLWSCFCHVNGGGDGMRRLDGYDCDGGQDSFRSHGGLSLRERTVLCMAWAECDRRSPGGEDARSRYRGLRLIGPSRLGGADRGICNNGLGRNRGCT